MEQLHERITDYIRTSEINTIQSFGSTHQKCKRKAVGCSILEVDNDNGKYNRIVLSTNGPSGEGNECSNVVGDCGCSHAEPRAIIKYFRWLNKHITRNKVVFRIMVCNYSPCTNCANIIVDSRVIHYVAYRILTEHDVRGLEILDRSLLTLQL